MKGIQDTSNLTYRQLMGNGLRYTIPHFQRDYTWDTEQWDDLWFDILALQNNFESEHYMGYLVLQTADNKKFSVIDGQQRITTLSIVTLAVLKCLQNLVEAGTESDNNKRRIEALRNSYIGYIDPVTLISDNKLKLNRNGNAYYVQHLTLLKDLPLRGINQAERQLRSCFEWFYLRIKKSYTTGQALAQLIDLIADKLFFTRITVTDEFNAFRVFETLNARGVQLSSADLLKNYLFSIVDEDNSNHSELEALETLWSDILDTLASEKLEDYLRYYWNSKNKFVRKNELFKTIKRSIAGKSDAFALVRELHANAEIYMALQEPENERWRNKDELRSRLKELKLFRIRQVFSLFLSGYRSLPENKFEELVKTCAVISFRYNVIGGKNPNEQEIIYNAAAIRLSAEKAFSPLLLQEAYIQDNDFVADFKSKTFRSSGSNHKTVKYILAKIEKYLSGSEIDTDSEIYSVEHILPESADTSWGTFSHPEIERSVYRLGNLTLLEKSLNKKAGSNSYQQKKMVYRESKITLANQIPEHYEEWSEDAVASRQNMLASAAKSIWRIDFDKK